jgi:coenzyme PQQ precursor peptide PqqA
LELPVVGDGQTFQPNLSANFSATVSAEQMMKKTWTSPKVVEIAVGMEINSYACARI